jgi:hypothetical protein
VEPVDERGDQDRGQRPRGEELEEHVRDRVGGLEGVAEVRRAEHGRDDQHAEEPQRA